MERIRSLGRYQKAVLLATALMALVFIAVYLTVTARVGFAFGDAILLDVHEVSADVYTGKVRGAVSLVDRAAAAGAGSFYSGTAVMSVHAGV